MADMGTGLHRRVGPVNSAMNDALPPTFSDELRQVAEEYFCDIYRANPGRATELGIHEYDDQLGDHSPAAIADLVVKIKRHLARAERLDDSRLTLEEQSDLLLLRSDMQTTLIWHDRLAEWRRNPEYYPSTALFALYPLCVREFAPVEQRMSSVLARLRAVPELLATAERNLKNPPAVFVRVAIESAEGAIDFFQGQIPELARQTPNLESELHAANGAALVALTNYLTYLKTTLIAKAKGRFAIGKQAFEELLRVEHMLDLSSEELDELGRETFAKTKESLEQTAAKIDASKNWPTLVAELRREHPAAGDLLDAYREEMGRLQAFVAERRLAKLPVGAELEVIDTPGFARSTTPYAAYMPPAPFETTQKGQFWVTPIDTSATDRDREAQLEEHNRYSITLTAIHEAYPGHHLQLVTANRVGSWLRKHFSSTIFCEGWALYCEQLMAEQGYLADARAQLFQLKDQLWRAARVVIDVGLQTGTMTVSQAIRMLVDEVHMSRSGAQAEVSRYTMTPTQPMSYTLGKLEILRLREEHAGMPLTQFHDLILSHGTVPPSIVRRELAGKARTTGQSDSASRQTGE